ncbi:MAG: response regulator [Ignavibacteriales bacterium]|nr:response regulator [Ignavibacteriales bacterium]
MKILLITNDRQIIELIQQNTHGTENELFINLDTHDPLEVHSSVHRIHPSLMIIDDDFLNPNSVRIIRSLKDINKNFKIIFITSNEGLELGKEISQIGVYYYALKPIQPNELIQAVQSVIKLNKSSVQIN